MPHFCPLLNLITSKNEAVVMNHFLSIQQINVLQNRTNIAHRIRHVQNHHLRNLKERAYPLFIRRRKWHGTLPTYCEYLCIIYLKWNSVIFLGVPLVSLHHSFSQLCSFLKASCHSVVAEILAPAHFDVTLNDFISYVFDNFLKIKWEKCSRCYNQGSSSKFRI